MAIISSFEFDGFLTIFALKKITVFGNMVASREYFA
jgi:hypothetical protein